MNIVTICTPTWIDGHLYRFMRLVLSAMPDAKLHLLLVAPPGYGKAELDSHSPWLVMNNWLTKLKIVHTVFGTDDSGLQDLMYFDRLRTRLLDIFALDEALYMDPDIDVLSDLGAIQSTEPGADVLVVPSPIMVGTVQQLLLSYGLPVDRMLNIGTIYLRKGSKAWLREAWQDVVTAAQYQRPGFVPGSAIWNVMLARHGQDQPGSVGLLAPAYGQSFWDMPNTFVGQAVHYTGPQSKRFRPYVKWVGTGLTTWKMELSPANGAIPGGVLPEPYVPLEMPKEDVADEKSDRTHE